MGRDALLLQQRTQLSELTTTIDSLRARQVSFLSVSSPDLSLRYAGDSSADEGRSDDSLDGVASSALVAPRDEGGAAPLSPGEGVRREGVVSPGVRAAEEQRLGGESPAAALRRDGAL